MWGYEGEELEDIEATIQHVKKTSPDVFFTTVAYPIKGTPYFAEVSRNVEALKPWSVGSDREVRLRGRHSRQFYGYADQLIRSEVELGRIRDQANIDSPTITRLKDKIADSRASLYASAHEVEA